MDEQNLTLNDADLSLEFDGGEEEEEEEEEEEVDDAQNEFPDLEDEEDTVEDDLLGKVFHSEEAAYRMYCQYAYKKGFSVRKAKHRYMTGSLAIRQKDYACSKEGFKQFSTPFDARPGNKLTVRTGCKAMVRFTVTGDEWKVTRFIAEHNHELASIRERRFLRSARRIMDSDSSLMDSFFNAKMKNVDANNKVVSSSGASVGTGKRSYNYFVDERELFLITITDVQRLLRWFKMKRKNDSMFFHDFQPSRDGRMKNFFWRDGRSMLDYEYFGDAVALEMTPCTSKCNLKCASFVGLNNHSQPVLFACSFLVDESIASFVWLFETFLESMRGKPPRTIITKHNSDMAKALEEVLTNTRHRLFHWDLMRDARSHLPGLDSNSGLHQMLHKCMQGCVDETEFQGCWLKLIEGCGFRTDSWLHNLYEVREKWSTAFVKDTFLGGLASSESSETARREINRIADKTVSLPGFLIELDNLVVQWRKSEEELNLRCNQGIPNLAIKSSVICQHAAKLYTHKVYELFEQEFLEGVGAMACTEMESDGAVVKYSVVADVDPKNVRTVQINSSTLEVTCSCQKFESVGLLCSHVLRCLRVRNINHVPEKCVLRRWTKNAREWTQGYSEPNAMSCSNKKVQGDFQHEIMRFTYDMVRRSQGSDSTRRSLWNKLYQVNKELVELLEDSGLNSQTTVGDGEMVDDAFMENGDICEELSNPATNVQGPRKPAEQDTSILGKKMKQTNHSPRGQYHEKPILPKPMMHGFPPMYMPQYTNYYMPMYPANWQIQQKDAPLKGTSNGADRLAQPNDSNHTAQSNGTHGRSQLNTESVARVQSNRN